MNQSISNPGSFNEGHRGAEIVLPTVDERHKARLSELFGPEFIRRVETTRVSRVGGRRALDAAAN